MVTFIRMFLPLILLVMTAGVDVQQNWGVNYSPSYVCVLRGASVKMSCTIKHPSDHEVKTVFWTKTAFVSVGEPPDLCSDPEYRGRVQCLSENKDTYSITLSNVTQADKRIYYFRFTTNREDGKWTGFPGVQLDVTDLQVETQQRVNERDSVTLTCKSTCSLTEETTFIWSRNTQTVTKGRVTVNQLQLLSVTRDDTGDYRCAVRGKDHLSSPEVYLDVTYPPEKVSVSISGSGEIVLGDSVNLTCSSDSNPPAHIYTWFKVNESSSVGSGQSYSISNFNSSHSGRFYCEAQNQYGSQRSAALSVSVAGVQTDAPYIVSGIVVGLFIIIIIIIIMILFIRKKRRDGGAEVMRQNQENRSSAGADPTNDLPISPQLSTNQSDALYACIAHKKPNSSRNAQTAAGDVDNVQYASVQYFRNKEKKKTEDKDTNFEMSHSSDPSSSVDVIYSSVK